MIHEEIKNIKGGKGELRKFGITMGVVFLLLGGFSWWRGKEYYFYFLCLSGAFIFLALIIPSVLKPINKMWRTLAILMSWVMTRVILSVLFYLGITPMSILARLVGKDFLKIKFERKDVTNYWIKKEKQVFEKADYEKQF